MSLFIDSDHVTAADLTVIDPEVPSLASKRSIVLEGDGGIIRKVWSDCANRLSVAVQNFGGTVNVGGSLVSALSGNQPKLRLDHFVVSSPYDGADSPFKEWLTAAALKDFYQSVLFKSASDDRLEAKYQLAKERETGAWRILQQFGLPIVLNPLAAPGALHVHGSGTWAASATSGGSATASSWGVVLTWVDESSYVSSASRGNAESGRSEQQTVILALNERVHVDIAGLVPPGSVAAQVSVADGTFWTRRATGWNVYAATEGNLFRLQNASPIPIATTTYDFTPTATGAVISPGQLADSNYTITNSWNRG